MNRLDSAVEWVALLMAGGVEYWTAVFHVHDNAHVGMGNLIDACNERGL